MAAIPVQQRRHGWRGKREGLGEDRLAEDTGGTMAKAGAANKTTAKTEMEPPRAYGPRGIGGLVARVARPAFRRRSPAASQIMTEWATILGPDLGARTAPRRFTAGTLTIACDGPVAMELQHLAPQLIARINGHVGQRLVERLRFVQLAVVSHVIEPPRAPRPRRLHRRSRGFRRARCMMRSPKARRRGQGGRRHWRESARTLLTRHKTRQLGIGSS